MTPFATTNLKWWAQPRILLGTCLLLLSPESENKLDTHLFFTTLGNVVVVLTAILVALIVYELLESKVRPLKSGGFARNVSDGKTAKRRPKKTQRTKQKKKRTSKKQKKINRRKRNTASTTLTRASPPKQSAVPNEAVYQVMRRACYRIFDRFELTVQRQRDNIERLYYAVFRRADAQSEEQRRQCLERSGVLTRSPRRPDMAAAATRITTFRNWPHPQSLPPERMAGAGFYYTGQRDLVRCFYCNQDLEKWEAADDPWNEHSRHSPNCPYVQYVNAYLPDDSLTMSEGDIRRLMDSQQRARQPARARDDDTSGLRSRCWSCNSNDRQVVFPCGHKNVCWKCYKCSRFLESLVQPLPTCCNCQRPFAEVFQDKIIQISVIRRNQMRRVRPGHKRGR